MNDKDKKEALKGLIKELHDGATPGEVKERFKDVLGDTNPTDIGRAEEELVKEGMPREEIRKLCDVHLEVMRDSLQGIEIEVSPGHPLHTFREEHERILGFLGLLRDTVKEIKESSDPETVKEKLPTLQHVAEHLMEVEKHNLREENVLFPYLEKHGITEPPAVMWSEHNELRELKKKLLEIIAAHEDLNKNEFAGQLEQVTGRLDQNLSSHIFKENNILYPMALQALEAGEWPEVRRQCDELGYCCFTPETAGSHEQQSQHVAVTGEEQPDDVLTFPTGSLSREEVEWVFNTLPVEVTFVDKDDTFRYFSGTKDRVFARARASLGRKVQRCHPQKSLHMVNEILEDFRGKKRDSASFWIQLEGRTIHISYFAVRNDKGEYLGCLETIQDITDLKDIEGEKKLLD